MRVETRLVGTSPLVMKNVRLADPTDEFTKAIGRITDKGKNMTDTDLQERSRLQFCGGLYIDSDGPYEPSANVRRCFVEAATMRRKGTAMERALSPVELKLPLLYDGPRTADELWNIARFRYTTMVGMGVGRQKRKVQATRPWFPQWELVAEWELFPDALDYEDFEAIVKQAGVVTGLGDNRRNGFGRFTVEVKKL